MTLSVYMYVYVTNETCYMTKETSVYGKSVVLSGKRDLHYLMTLSVHEVGDAFLAVYT